MRSIFFTFCIAFMLFVTYSCTTDIPKNSTIYVIPVYGQSLALGEEAKLVTNFDSLKKTYKHRIRTELLDEEFGFFSNTLFKQKIKRIFRDKRRLFEVSCYGLGEYLAERFNDTIYICTFPAGQGDTEIEGLSKGSAAYEKLIAQIKDIQEIAKKKHYTIIIPAFCWHQGENDLVWNTPINYKEKLKSFRLDLEKDINNILKQERDLTCILYQTNCLTLAKDSFDMNAYACPQIKVPMAQMELIKEDCLFMACSPVYPYDVVREYVHIDGIGQKRLGYMEGVAIEHLLNQKEYNGLTPDSLAISGDTIVISFNIPYPPLKLDTIMIHKAEDYGFSVISPNNKNILKTCLLKDNQVYLLCDTCPNNAKVRYAANGKHGKSGRKNGSRGNLRDSQGDSLICKIKNKTYPMHNWCYMFEMTCNHY